MTWVIERCIVKGRIGSYIQTRNMFVAELNVVSPDTYQSVWEEYIQLLFNDVSSYLSSVFSIDTLQIQSLEPTGWFDLDEFNFTFSGLGTGDAYNSQIAAVLIGKGIGPRKVGRKFISPLIEAAVDGNNLAAGALAAFVQMAIDYVAPLTTTAGSILQPGIVDKGANFVGFSSGVFSTILGTIRRRKEGRGI